MPRLTDAEARAVCPHDHATCDSCGEGLTGIPESRIPAFRAEPGALREALERAFDAIEAACPVCGGDRWTTESDPTDETGQTPMQVECWDAEHVVVINQRAALSREEATSE